jgi:hypothetical protein
MSEFPRYRLTTQEREVPHTSPHVWGLAVFYDIWIRLTPSHLFFIHHNIMHFVTLGVGAVKGNRPRLSIT